MSSSFLLHRGGEGCIDSVSRSESDLAIVRREAGYSQNGSVACEVRDTGNGFIARFPATVSCEQDNYVCLDYASARNLVLGLSAFKNRLSFRGK